MAPIFQSAMMRALMCLAAIFGLAAPAAAHPHVFVDAKSEVVFDAAGRIASVRNIWRFDEAFSSYATLNLDEDGDGKLGEPELEALAKVNVESLHEYDFFTYLSIGGEQVAFTDVSEYFLTYDGTRLTLYYTLPLMEPAAVDAQAKLEVFDPEYFVAFTFVTDDPASLVDAPGGCTETFHPPEEIDDATMALLNAIPMDQREIPDELVTAASVLANSITVDCVLPTAAPAAAPPDDPPAPRVAPPSPFGVGTTDSPGGWWMTGPLGPFFVAVARTQAAFYKEITGSFAAIKADGTAAWLLLGLSFLYGIFHAAGPGHGKAVITSYLFATGESLKRGVAISFASAFVQAFTAIAIVVVAAVVFRAAAQTMTVATVWIETASYALIVLVGLWLLWVKTFGGGHHHHHHVAQPAATADAHAGHDHDHDHAHGEHAHDLDEDRTAPRASRRGLITAILAVGIRPCSGAIIVLVFALSQGMLAVGIAATLVMAVGTGLTVALLAILAVSAHGFALRLAGTNSVVAYRVVRGLEILAALLILLLGLVLLGGSLATLGPPA